MQGRFEGVSVKELELKNRGRHAREPTSADFRWSNYASWSR